jgi:hypothetical protein
MPDSNVVTLTLRDSILLGVVCIGLNLQNKESRLSKAEARLVHTKELNPEVEFVVAFESEELE